jgi:nitrate reductase gamma subunit
MHDGARQCTTVQVLYVASSRDDRKMAEAEGLKHQMVLFVFLEHASFVSGHREALVCTQWMAGFVVTPEASHQSPLLEIFSTFVCAAGVALIIPIAYMWTRRIHSQN